MDDLLEYEERVLGTLTSINSEQSNMKGYEECARFIIEEAERMGQQAKMVYSQGEGPRPNVKVEVGGPKPVTMFAAHYDTVPAGPGWRTDPLALTKVGDKLFGRGAADDKGAVAVLLGLLRSMGEMKVRNGLTFCFTADEEVGGALGLGDLVTRLNPMPDLAIIVDSESEVVSCGASGIINGDIIIRGRQGHAGYPHLAKNPIFELPRVIRALEGLARRRERKRSSLPLPPGYPHRRVWGRFSPTIIRGGFTTNIIPPDVTITFDMRLLPEEDVKEAIAELNATVAAVNRGGAIGVELTSVRGGGNYLTNPDNALVKRFIGVAESYGCRKGCVGELGGNDGKYTYKMGIPTLGIGVIDYDSNIHAPDEFVRLSTMLRVKRILRSFIEQGK